MMKTIRKRFRHGEEGFTLVELLVVVAVLGVVSAVAIPNVGKFIGHGAVESYQAELHNIQTAAVAMLVDSTTAALTPVTTATADMDTVQTTDFTPLILSNYLAGLNSDGTTKSGVTYTFTADGTIAQTTP